MGPVEGSHTGETMVTEIPDIVVEVQDELEGALSLHRHIIECAGKCRHCFIYGEGADLLDARIKALSKALDAGWMKVGNSFFCASCYNDRVR